MEVDTTASAPSEAARPSVAFDLPAALPPSAAAAPSASVTQKAKLKRVSMAAALQDPSSLLQVTPPACPPSLTNRTATDTELFQYYALRGHAEVLGAVADDGAVRTVAVLAANGMLTQEQREMVREAQCTAEAEAPLRGEGPIESPVHEQTWLISCAEAVLAADDPAGHSHAAPAAAAAVAPEKYPVPPPKPTDLSQPLFPRLRPSVVDDQHAAVLKQQHDLDRREELRERNSKAALPPVETYYATLYRPKTDVSATMEAGMADVIAKSCTANATGQVSNSQSSRGRPSPTSAARAGMGATNGSGTKTFAGTAAAAASVDSGPASTVTEAQRAALLHECRSFVSEEIEEVFVGTYYKTHPEEQARKRAEEEAAARRRSTRLAAELMEASGGNAKRKASMKKKAGAAGKKGAVPRREGSTAENLRFMKAGLLSLCDEQGQITGADVERLFADVPFELQNTDALRDFLQMIRQVTEVKQREADNAATALANFNHTTSGAGGMENSLSGASRRSLHPGASGSQQQQSYDGSGRLHGSGAFPGNSLRRPTLPGAGASRASLSQGSTGNTMAVAATSMVPGASASAYSRPAYGGANSSTAAAVAGGGSHAAAPQASRVLVREILGALNAIVNGNPTTRSVVRWVCFNTLAAEGQGYIHKATLESLRRQRREECEGPQAEFTASIVKALDDAFRVMAAEEEAEYIRKSQKGKKKSKKAANAVKLAPNQNTVIPLHVMRRSHMDYETFCRYFDQLPQLCAAFMHVWVGLLLNGRIGAVDEAALRLQQRQQQPLPQETTLRANARGAADADVFGQTQSGHTARRARISVTSALPTAVTAGVDERMERDRASLTGSPSSTDLASTPGIATARDGTVSSQDPVPSQSAEVAMMDGTLTSSPTEVMPGTYPIALLGANAFARRAAIQAIVHAELAVMREVAESLHGRTAASTENN